LLAVIRQKPTDHFTIGSAHGTSNDGKALIKFVCSFGIQFLGIKARHTFTFNIRDQLVFCNTKSSPALRISLAPLCHLDHTPLTVLETEFCIIRIHTVNLHKNRHITRRILHIQQRVRQHSTPQVVSLIFL
jgi:hypothetical protein